MAGARTPLLAVDVIRGGQRDRPFWVCKHLSFDNFLWESKYEATEKAGSAQAIFAKIVHRATRPSADQAYQGPRG